MNTRTDYTVLIYSASSYSEQGLGPHTIANLETFQSMQERLGHRFRHVVLAAGIPFSNKAKDSCSTKPIAYEMKEWLIKHRVVFDKEIFTCGCETVSTLWDETLKMLSIVEENDLPRNIVVISSSCFAYPRLWLTWQFIRPEGWSIRFVCSPRKCSAKVFFHQEIPMTLKYAYWSILLRFSHDTADS